MSVAVIDSEFKSKEEFVCPVIKRVSDEMKVGRLVAHVRPVRIFTPGETVTDERAVLRGHGTYEEGEELKASVAGLCERVSKLVLVRALRWRYHGEVGDVVVGRVVEVQQKRWKVDVNARLDAVLMLSSVNLPGGELRRRSVEDERMMRKYLTEGDLISAEVQNVFSDGVLSLHKRSLKYGKLSQGTLVIVPASLIKRCKTHFHNICGASIIIGTNGYIWLYPPSSSTDQEASGGFAKNLDLRIGPGEREFIIRLRDCIMALADQRIMIYDTSIVIAYESSLGYSVQDMLNSEVMLEIALETQRKLNCPESM